MGMLIIHIIIYYYDYDLSLINLTYLLTYLLIYPSIYLSIPGEFTNLSGVKSASVSLSSTVSNFATRTKVNIIYSES